MKEPAAISPSTEDEYSEEETERRAREAIRRSFHMQPKSQKEMVGRVGRRKRSSSKTAKKAQ